MGRCLGILVLRTVPHVPRFCRLLCAVLVGPVAAEAYMGKLAFLEGAPHLAVKSEADSFPSTRVERVA